MRSRLRETFCPAVLEAGPVASTAAGNAMIAVCGLLSGMLLARMLGADGRGELAAIQAWPLVLTAAGNFGLTEAIAYYAATAPGRARTTLSSALFLAVPFSAVAVVAGVFVLPLALGAQTPEVQAAARISLLLVPLLTLTAAPHQALRGAGDYKAWNILRLVTPVGWVAALLGLAAFGQVRAVTAAWAFILVTAMSACVGHLYAWRTLTGPIAPTRDRVRPLLSYGAPTAVSALPQWLNLRLDQLVMIALLAPESLGLYAVAVAWGGAAQPLATVLAYVAVPALANTGDARRKAQLVYRSGAIVSACAAAVLVAVTPVVLPLVFGAEFRPAVPAALILAAAGALTGMNAVGGECLRGLGRPRAVLLAEIAGLVVTCIAVPILIPIAGIVGAAAASLASYLAVLLVQRRLISTAGDADGAAADRNLVLAIEAPPR